MFSTPAPSHETLRVSFPAPHVLHVALDRPDKFNALRAEDSFALDALWNWYESEPSLRCAILGTTSNRAWCAGGDLKELVSGTYLLGKTCCSSSIGPAVFRQEVVLRLLSYFSVQRPLVICHFTDSRANAMARIADCTSGPIPVSRD